MSEPLNEILRNDEGDDVEAHSLKGDSALGDTALDGVMANDEGDDVQAHSVLGPMDNVMDGVMRDNDDKAREVL